MKIKVLNYLKSIGNIFNRKKKENFTSEQRIAIIGGSFALSTLNRNNTEEVIKVTTSILNDFSKLKITGFPYESVNDIFIEAQKLVQIDLKLKVLKDLDGCLKGTNFIGIEDSITKTQEYIRLLEKNGMKHDPVYVHALETLEILLGKNSYNTS